MSSRTWSAVLIAAASLAIVLIVIAASPHAFFSNGYLAVATLLFALSVVFVGFSVRPHESRGSDAGWVGTIGVSVFFSVACWVFGLAAVISAGAGANRVSAVFDVLLALSALVAFGGTILASRAITNINTATDFKSSHTAWSDELRSIALRCRDEAAQDAISSLADEARFLSRDSTKHGFPENLRIGNSIEALETAVSVGDEQQVGPIVKLLREQFNARELTAKSERNRA
jgi:hypothetical protein